MCEEMSELGGLEKSILDDILQNPDLGRRTIAMKYNLSESMARGIVRRCKQIIKENESSVFDEVYSDLLEHNSKLEKQKQRLQDQQRIERKIRNRIRTENALSDITRELINIFENRIVEYKIPIHDVDEKSKIGIFQLSDIHFNELIDIHGNKFDFGIASKRLHKYVIEAKKMFKCNNIQQIVIAMTGDLLNSDRRTDELLNMSTNRARATALASIILEQVIVDLAMDFDVVVTYVTGNESRASEYMGSSDIMVSDNYDVTIFEMLKAMLRNTSIKFIDGSVGEKVIGINGKNILLMHGHQLKGNISKQSQQIKGKYSDRDIKIDYILFGHIHECLIADFYARSSSLCGANAYSDYTLQLTSRASQNIHFVSSDSINSMKIDLQEYEGYEGYIIDESLEAYNAKSISKGKDEKFIVVNVL